MASLEYPTGTLVNDIALSRMNLLTTEQFLEVNKRFFTLLMDIRDGGSDVLPVMQTVDADATRLVNELREESNK